MRSQKNILIVDDDPDIQLLFTDQLKRAGYRVRSACDGKSCAVAAKRDRPDLIILDLGLPGGDGESALIELRSDSDLAQMQVLVVSARDEQAWAEHVLRLGAIGYLQKPVEPARLLACVQELLSETEPLVRAPAAVPASTSAGTPEPVGTLSCPHCGHAFAALPARAGSSAESSVGK